MRGKQAKKLKKAKKDIIMTKTTIYRGANFRR